MANDNRKYPIPGLEIWKNPKNGFTVFQLHYSADPLKKDPKVLEEIRRSMPRAKWNQEYEIAWDSFEGLPVYLDWDKRVHGVETEIDPHLGLPLLVGMDFGLTPACIVGQYQEECLCIMKEYTAFNMGAERFMQTIIPLLRMDFPKWLDFKKDYLVFIDPSGQFRKDTDESTCMDILVEKGFENIIPGAIAWEERKRAVEHFLMRRTNKGPAFKVSLPNCPVLVRGFQGGYRYPDRIVDQEPNKIRPVKDAHSHPHDALQYLASRLLSTTQDYIKDIPIPNYSWAGRESRP